MVLDIVDGQRRGRRAKHGQNSTWGKNIEKIRGRENDQNSTWSKSAHLQMCPHDACRAFENQVQIQSTETCECGTVISGRDEFDCLEFAPLFHCEFWVWQTLSFKFRASAFPRVTDGLRVAVMVRSLNLLDDRVSSAVGCVPMIRNLLTRRGKTLIVHLASRIHHRQIHHRGIDHLLCRGVDGMCDADWRHIGIPGKLEPAVAGTEHSA